MTQMPSDPARPETGPTAAPTTPTTPTTPPADAAGPATGTEAGAARSQDPLRPSLTGRAWTAVVASGLVLLLLIIFIAQNTQKVTVAFLGWKGSTPLAVALLIAAVAGLFIATVAGTLRIWQLRRRVRREAR